MSTNKDSGSTPGPDIQEFFNAELGSLNDNIERLQHRIDDSDGQQDAGERALLDVQIKRRAIAQELAAQSPNFSTAMRVCHQHLEEKERAYRRISQNSNPSQALRSSKLWDAEDELEYLVYLANQMKDTLEKHEGGE